MYEFEFCMLTASILHISEIFRHPFSMFSAVNKKEEKVLSNVQGFEPFYYTCILVCIYILWNIDYNVKNRILKVHVLLCKQF